jgi:hypothetical protein
MSVDILNYMNDWTGDHALAFRAYQMLREKYPQINEKTKVMPAESNRFWILLPTEWHVDMDMVRVKRAGIKAAFLQTVGDVLHNRKLSDRGHDWQPNPRGTMPPRKEIKTELWGWRTNVAEYRLALAYEPLTDTLYVYKRWSSDVPLVTRYD